MAAGKSLTQGKPWKLILAFAVPVLFGILLQQLYNTVDTIVVGNFVGQDALSAVGTTSPLTMFFLAIANGFSAGAGVLIAQHFGAGKEQEMRDTASTSISLLLIMGLVCTALAMALCGVVCRYLLKVPENLMGDAVIYFEIYAAGLIFQFGYNIIAAILRAVGDSKATLYFLLIASVLNVVLDIVFVGPCGWGVAGAAIATVIAQVGSCAAGAIYMYKKYPVFKFNLRDLKLNGHITVDVLKTGFPMALQQASVSFGFMFIQRAVNGYGEDMIASFTVAQKVETYLTIPANAFQVTMATFVGQNLGAENTGRAIKGAWQAVLLTEAVTLCISVAVFFLASYIVALFGVEHSAADLCLQHTRVSALLLLILAAYFPTLGVFQGARKGFYATIVVIAALAVRVISTYTLCYVPLFGQTIIWWNQLFGYAAGLFITWLFFFFGRWKEVVQ